MEINLYRNYLSKTTSIAGLVVFRIGFGVLMVLALLRFIMKGWVRSLYIEPKFHFTYYGFEWVKPLGNYTYIIFIIALLSAFCVAIGYKYYWSIFIFFCSFTYIELMDKTTYLNHYYFVSICSFLLCFLPCHWSYSVDAYHKGFSVDRIPKWCIDSLKLLFTIVYFYAGLVKINSDWLLRGVPLSIWLATKYDFPVLGNGLFQNQSFVLLMSWMGMLYDLSIAFLLWNSKTRTIAYMLVVVFHLMTALLFPIGIFPYVMIIGALVFFDAIFHLQLIALLKSVFNLSRWKSRSKKLDIQSRLIPFSFFKKGIILLFFIFQLLFPFRYLFYPDELFWTEEGFRFSWRVMLIEKAGETTFRVTDSVSKNYFLVQNKDFLTPFQEKQMGFQPDFILQYAHFLGDHFKSQGHQNIQVFTDSFVALNGRLSKRFIDPRVDLYTEKESFRHKTWILPFDDEITGF